MNRCPSCRSPLIHLIHAISTAVARYGFITAKSLHVPTVLSAFHRCRACGHHFTQGAVL